MAVTPRETEEQWLLFVETVIETKKRKNALLVSNIVLFVYCIKATMIQLSVTIPVKVFTKLRGSSSLHWLSKADVGSYKYLLNICSFIYCHYFLLLSLGIDSNLSQILFMQKKEQQDNNFHAAFRSILTNLGLSQALMSYSFRDLTLKCVIVGGRGECNSKDGRRNLSEPGI